MGNEDLEKLEDLVSNTIQKSLPVVRKTLPLNEALKIDGVVSLENEVGWLVDWLVGCFEFNGHLRQYFSLYQAASQRGRKREKREREKEERNDRGE